MNNLLWSLVWLLPAAAGAFVVFIVAAVMWWVLGAGYSRRSTDSGSAHNRRVRNPAAQLAELRRNGACWAVMVRADAGKGCVAVEQEKRSIFLLHQAPTLPLDQCALKRCQCYYSPLPERRRRDVLPGHLDDRRAGAKVRWYRAARPAPGPSPGGSTQGIAPRPVAAMAASPATVDPLIDPLEKSA